ncbi:MAG TPA: tail fiber protein [Pyrinomonadaceae bacterium]|jgi:microcystin-dependent protein
MDPFLAEIRIFPFSFPPKGWAYCNGQLLPLSQNTALFALVGTFYGGDGKSTFALPNLQDSVPMDVGQGQGLSERYLGEQSGTETVTLLDSEIPVHTHGVQSVAAVFAANSNIVTGNSFGKSSQGNAYVAAGNTVQMSDEALTPTGSDFPHNNLQPYLVLNFCIALQGVFPQRP